MKQVTFSICAFLVIFQLHSVVYAASLFSALASAAGPDQNIFSTALGGLPTNSLSAISNPASLMSAGMSAGTSIGSSLVGEAINTATSGANAFSNMMPSTAISGGSSLFPSSLTSSSGDRAATTAFNFLSVGMGAASSISGLIADAISSGSLSNKGAFAEKIFAMFNKANSHTNSMGSLMTG